MQAKCQSLLYFQLTGTQLSKDLSEDEVKQSLKHAFSDQRLLLVLDDCWEREHANQLIFVDDSTQSKVLISSRVHGVLEGVSYTYAYPFHYDSSLHTTMTHRCTGCWKV